MFCAKCGKQINDGAAFCTYCGQPVGTRPAPGNAAQKDSVTTAKQNSNSKNAVKPAPKSGAGSKKNTPKKKTPAKARKKKSEGKFDGIFGQILFFFVGAIIMYLAIGDLAVGFYGEYAKAENVSLSFYNKGGQYGGKDRSMFYLSYDFEDDDGNMHSGIAFWKGWGHTPDSGYGAYHVGYLEKAPYINRFVKYDSVKEQRRDIRLEEAKFDHFDYVINNMKKEMYKNIAGTFARSFLYGFVGYFLLACSLPLPFFWSKADKELREEAKERRREEKEQKKAEKMEKRARK